MTSSAHNKENKQQSLGFYRLSPQEFETGVHEAVRKYQEAIDRVKELKEFDWANAIAPLEAVSENLDRIWGLLDHENAVSSTQEIRDVHDKLLPLITNLHSETLQDAKLCEIYQQIKQSKKFATLTKPQQSIIEHALRNFKLGGVDLPVASRNTLKELHERLSLLESSFANNVLDATEDWSYHVTTAQKFLLDGLPERLITLALQNAAKVNKSGWVLKLDTPTYLDVASYAKNRMLREEFYTAYYTRASAQGPMAGKYDNTKIIAEILELRHKIAVTVGFDNYAQYSLVPKMANSTDEVNKFLHDLTLKVKPFAEKEYKELKEFAKDQGFAEELEAWDVGFYSQQMRLQRYDINEEELRIYFPIHKVLSGLFGLVGKLFGIKINEIFDFQSWHPSVRMFEVKDATGHLRGHFYTDLYTREGKRGGAWMAECMARMRFGTNLLQTPIAYLNCNFPPPQDNQPGLLTHQEVLILFHEFGHTLHHVLTQVDYYSVAGLNGVEWDAVELPSQLMENWAWEWQVIQEITENIYTNEPMPRTIFDKLLASKNFHSGLFLNRQLLYSIFDFRIHESAPEDTGLSAYQILEKIRKEISVTNTPKTNRFENSFSHIFAGGYAAGYYSYLWAEVLACDSYARFTAKDLIDPKIGGEFLAKVLEKGGSEPAMDLVEAFLGRKPNIDALLKQHALT